MGERSEVFLHAKLLFLLLATGHRPFRRPRPGILPYPYPFLVLSLSFPFHPLPTLPTGHRRFADPPPALREGLDFLA